ncbi:hypothetical protein FGB62_100g331 [Gracilaria domingensis]|nr:hypothetical protein FGB62_100g331 [Gracilaria domingensis]
MNGEIDAGPVTVAGDAQRRRKGQGDRRHRYGARRRRGCPANPPDRKMSETQGPLEDEPLILDYFGRTVIASAPLHLRPEVHLSHAGFIDIIESAYSMMGAQNRFLHRNVSLEMFTYYCSQLLLARLNEVDEMCQRPFDSDHKNRVRSVGYEIPDFMSLYLKSIGNFSLPTGQRYQPAGFGELNAGGHFGEFGIGNYSSYNSIPTPYVLVRAIQQGLADKFRPDWDVPAIMPSQLALGALGLDLAEGDPVARPTENLLGWRLLSRPHIDTRNQLTAMGFTDVLIPYDFTAKWKFSPSLMACVSNYFKANPSGFKWTLWTLPDQRFGSTACTGFLEVADPDSIPSRRRYSRSEMIFRSPTAQVSQIIILSYVGCFRVKENVRTDGSSPYSSFVFGAVVDDVFQEVALPLFLQEIQNDRFSGLRASILNQEEYRGPSLDRFQILTQLCRNAINA